MYNSYFESFPDLKKFFTLQFDRAAYFGYIEFNPITKRKFFFDKETNGYFKHHATVSDKYFWIKEDNPKSINREYNAAKSEMQRLSQNYPIQGEHKVPCLNPINSVNPVMGIPSQLSA